MNNYHIVSNLVLKLQINIKQQQKKSNVNNQYKYNHDNVMKQKIN